ncbi:MAG TPA: phosphoglycerate dehydrogenase [Balneolaceae bacterium]|nr:phosphoglycerate dehydrogenase [Balneolaceae bacterium]
MPFKILLADNVNPVCEDVFAERDIETVRKMDLSKSELLEEIPAYDGIVVRSSTTVDEELIQAATNLKVVGRAGVGVDNIDIPAATARGILVMNTPGGNTVSTAEHTCGMILALIRNIPTAVATVKGGGWNRKKYMGSEVYGKTLGVIGLGKVGSEVAQRMQGFGMDVKAYDPFSSREKADQLGVDLVELDELLESSDFISAHTPLTQKTKGLISLENVDKLKDGVRLINCARGGILKEEDLIEMIEDGPVSGIALDSYSEEPPGEDLRELLEHPAIICTPHLGASTEEAQEKVAAQVARQMSDALNGKKYSGSLNGKSIALTTNKEVKPYLALAEKLGSFAMQIAPKNATDFDFEYSGKCSKYADVLTDSILKGMLEHHVTETVNLINARVYADELGLKVSETTSPAQKTYSDLVTIRLDDGAAFNKISAAVFGDGDYRIVQVDDFNIELRLEGEILLYTNIDRPGMLAAVSGALAEQDINIASLSLGRSHKGSNAVTAVSVDKAMNDEERQPLAKLEGINSLKYISLSDGE